MTHIFKRKTSLTILAILFTSSTLLGAELETPGIAWGMLIMTLLGGLSLFLYGMEKMSAGLKKAAGESMRNILSALTRNKLLGLTVGAFVTMIVQSSSATTVMLVSFVQSQLMTFTQSLSIILGADIGSTVTAQLIAFNLSDYALVMIILGFGISMFGKTDHQKNLGESLMGFGILFYGMKLMSDAMAPLKSYEPFIGTLHNLENPLLGILIGAIFTALIQSSGAFTGIIIVLAQQGLISLEAGIPLLMGANIGTCVTAGLASIGASRAAKRVALAHVSFKILGVMLLVFWIPTYADFIRYISPATTELAGASSRQIANAHTIFNVSLAFLFLPFTNLVAGLVTRVLPDRKDLLALNPVVWHLDDSSIETPALALDLARAEIARMAKILGRMLEAVIEPFFKKDPGLDKIHPSISLLQGIEMREKKVDYLRIRISEYLQKIGQKKLSDDQVSEVFAMMSIVSYMENIGDIIQRSVMPLILKKRALSLSFSKQGEEELLHYHTKVCKQISRLLDVFTEMDLKKARNIILKEEKYINLESKYRIFHLERIHAAREESVQTHDIHMELLDLLKRINVYAGDIAKTLLTMEKIGR
ncbi:MAG: Na/Pi cotransporter family protein [Candidatus Marinimicrobia bacterium]|nr:Na/Pi cotransporter family protein [Candidatus Neomarinimicrobiota bacterium]MCF7923372.1 Na/Pi cotransporter family protein [Candidatus Neomarinimicrobiota bacterium]